jgi:HK97 family phage prohead protease
METRELKIEVRAAQDDPNSIEGYAAVFDSESDDLGGFREVLKPGCFDRALRESGDILCVVDHDRSKLLGRTSSGTCKITQDDKGLRFRCSMPDTQLGRDMRALIARGDYNSASFKFAVDPRDDEAEDWEEKNGRVLRTIRSIAKLGDVSPVLVPAYRATSVKVK